MDENTTIETTKEIEKTGRGILRWTIYIAIGLGILATIFWALFYSIDLANDPSIIPLRIWYQSTYWQVEGIFLQKQSAYPPFAPVYTIQAVKQPTGVKNLYLLTGIIFNYDLLQNSISILGFDQKVYIFDLRKNTVTDPNSNSDNLVPVMEVNTAKFIDSGKKINEAHALDADNDFFARAQKDKKIIQLRWSDDRNLNQILKDYNKNPQLPINGSSTNNFAIITFI